MSVPTPSPSDLVPYDPQTWVDVPTGTTPPPGALTMDDDNLNHLEAGVDRSHRVALAAYLLLNALQDEVASLPDSADIASDIATALAPLTAALDDVEQGLAAKVSTSALSSAVAGLATPEQATALAQTAAETAVSALIDGAPDAANTLRELKELLDTNASGDAGTAAALAALVDVVAGKATPAQITAAIAGLAAVARTGSYTDLAGRPDLSQYLTTTAASATYVQTNARRLPWPTQPVAFFDFTDTAPPLRNRVGVGAWEVPLTAGTFAKSTEDGPFGKALVLDGATSYILPKALTGALDVTEYSDEFTVIAWGNSLSSATACFASLHREGNTTPARVWAMYSRAGFYGGHMRFSPHYGGQDGATPGYPYNKDYASTGEQQVEQRWRMYAMVVKDQTVSAYVDGFLSSYATYTEPTSPNGQGLTYAKNPYVVGRPLNRSLTPKHFAIGAATITSGSEAAPVNHETGLLGGLAILDRALTAAELMKLRLATLRRGSTLDPIVVVDFATAKTTDNGTGETAGGAKTAASRGYFSFQGATCTDVSTATTAGTYYVNGVSTVGQPSFLLRSGGGTATPGIAGQYLAGLNFSQVKRLDITLNNNDPTATACRLIVRVGGAWYATEATYVTTVAHSSGADWSGKELFGLDVSLDGALWRDLTVVPGSTLALASASRSAPIPAGEFQALGVYSNGQSGTQRISPLRAFSKPAA